MSGLQPGPEHSSRAAINDCWNKIGVRGDGSCPELRQYTHCRNCPVYSAAAVELLDGALPADYLAEWTQRLAAKEQVAVHGGHSVAVFQVAAELFALPTSLLVEVARMRAIHALPHRRGGAVLGLVNVRGELLICVSLAALLSLEKPHQPAREKPRSTPQRLLVVSRDGERAAFPVDEVHGMHRFHPRELKDVPATVARSAATYMKAVLPWGEGTAGLLDEELLLYAVKHNLA